MISLKFFVLANCVFRHRISRLDTLIWIELDRWKSGSFHKLRAQDELLPPPALTPLARPDCTSSLVFSQVFYSRVYPGYMRVYNYIFAYCSKRSKKLNVQKIKQNYHLLTTHKLGMKYIVSFFTFN